MSLDPRLLTINSTALADLKKAYQEKNLTIIVGAGSSVQSGIPSWNHALRELLVNYVQSKYSDKPYNLFANDIHDYLSDLFSGQSPLIFAQLIKSRLSKEDYLEMVHKALYGHLSTPPVPGEIADSVSKLTSGLKGVVTFNYDEMLELAFQKNNIKYTSIWNASDLSSISGIPIYHPHGFLPYNRKKGEDYWIVFSEDEYHSQYFSMLGWSNVTIARALLESTCLFVSTSITDPNLRRIVDYIHRDSPDKKNYFIWSTPETGTISGLEAMLHDIHEKLFKESFEKLGLHPLWFFNSNGNQRWSDIPELLGEIMLP